MFGPAHYPCSTIRYPHTFDTGTTSPYLKSLELDAAKHKLKVEKKSGGEDAGKLRKLELGVEAATARFDQEVEAVRSLLAPLMDDEQMRVEACRAAAVTLRAMRDYFRRSLEVMEAFDGKVDLEHWAATGGAHGGPAVARGPSTTFLRQSSSMPVSNETPTSARNSYAQEQQHAKSPAPPVPVHRVAEQHPGVVPNRQQAGVASTQLPPPTSAKPVVGSAIAQRQAMLQQQLAQAAVSVATQQHRSSPVPASREVAPATPADCYRALYVFQAQQPGDLAMERGDVVEITGRKGDWWQARNVRTGETGSVPANYLERV